MRIFIRHIKHLVSILGQAFLLCGGKLCGTRHQSGAVNACSRHSHGQDPCNFPFFHIGCPPSGNNIAFIAAFITAFIVAWYSEY